MASSIVARQLAGGGGGPDVVSEEIVFILTVAGVLVIQYFVHRVKHVFPHDSYFAEMIGMVYQELTILGIVAFCLYSSEVLGLLHITLDEKHLFEKIHNTLFVSGLIYAGVVATMMVLSTFISKQWSSYDDMPFAEWKDRKEKLKALYTKIEPVLRKKLGRSTRTIQEGQHTTPWSIGYLRDLYTWYNRLLPVKFGDLKFFTIRKYHLQVQKFKFRLYLDKCKEHVFLQIVEISATSWSGFCVFLCFDLLARGIWHSYAPNADASVHFIVVNILLCLLAVFMYSRVRLGYVSVLSHSISEFDAQAAEDCNQHDYCVPAFRARAKTVHEKAKEKERELDDSFDLSTNFFFRTADRTPKFIQQLTFAWALNLALLLVYQFTLGTHTNVVWLVVVTTLLSTGYIVMYVYRTVSLFVITQYVGKNVDSQRMAAAILASEKLSKRKKRLSTMSRLQSRASEWRLGEKSGAHRFTSTKAPGSCLVAIVFMFLVATHEHPAVFDSVRSAAIVIEWVCMALLLLEQVLTAVWYRPKHWAAHKFHFVQVVYVIALLVMTAMGADNIGHAQMVRAFLLGLHAFWNIKIMVIPYSHKPHGHGAHGHGHGAHGQQQRTGHHVVTMNNPVAAAAVAASRGGGGGATAGAGAGAGAGVGAGVGGGTGVLSGHGEVPNAKASGPRTKRKKGGRLQLVTTRNFDFALLDHKSPWVLKVYSKTCKHCAALEPKWLKAVPEIPEDVAVGEMEGNENIRCTMRMGVKAYPTIFYFPSGVKTAESGIAMPDTEKATKESILEWVATRREAERTGVADDTKPEVDARQLAHELAAAHPLNNKKLPMNLDIRLVDLSGEAPIHVKHTTADVFEGKKVVMFGLPGAFTRTCSTMHLPGFVDLAGQIRDHGVDMIICLSCNDPYVMEAWGIDQHVTNQLVFLADADASFVRALKLEQDLSDVGLGLRSQRFSMIVDHGMVTQLNIEPVDVNALSVSGAYTIFKQLGGGGGGGHH